jgi:hypothetical protein
LRREGWPPKSAETFWVEKKNDSKLKKFRQVVAMASLNPKEIKQRPELTSLVPPAKFILERDLMNRNKNIQTLLFTTIAIGLGGYATITLLTSKENDAGLSEKLINSAKQVEKLTLRLEKLTAQNKQLRNSIEVQKSSLKTTDQPTKIAHDGPSKDAEETAKSKELQQQLAELKKNNAKLQRLLNIAESHQGEGSPNVTIRKFAQAAKAMKTKSNKTPLTKAQIAENQKLQDQFMRHTMTLIANRDKNLDVLLEMLANPNEPDLEYLAGALMSLTMVPQTPEKSRALNKRLINIYESIPKDSKAKTPLLMAIKTNIPEDAQDIILDILLEAAKTDDKGQRQVAVIKLAELKDPEANAAVRSYLLDEEIPGQNKLQVFYRMLPEVDGFDAIVTKFCNDKNKTLRNGAYQKSLTIKPTQALRSSLLKAVSSESEEVNHAQLRRALVFHGDVETLKALQDMSEDLNLPLEKRGFVASLSKDLDKKLNSSNQ